MGDRAAAARTVRRAAQFAACFPLYDSKLTSSAYNIILGALRRELANEPCLGAYAPGGSEPKVEEMFGLDTAAGQAARRRQH